MVVGYLVSDEMDLRREWVRSCLVNILEEVLVEDALVEADVKLSRLQL